MTRTAASRTHLRSYGRYSVVITDGGSGCGWTRATAGLKESASLTSPALAKDAEWSTGNDTQGLHPPSTPKTI